jgi:hypothetical protein
VLAVLRAKNLSATLTSTLVVDDGAGIVAATVVNQAASSQSNAVVTAEVWSTHAITATISGAGGPVQLSGMYFRVPLAVAGRAQLVPFAITVGLAPVSVPACVPPAGYGGLLLSMCGIPAFAFSGDAWVVNRDSATTIVVWRITRSAVVWEGNVSNTTGVNVRSSQLIPLPIVLPGDTLEFHTLAAPVIANSVTMGGVIAFVPLTP